MSVNKTLKTKKQNKNTHLKEGTLILTLTPWTEDMSREGAMYARVFVLFKRRNAVRVVLSLRV